MEWHKWHLLAQYLGVAQVAQLALNRYSYLFSASCPLVPLVPVLNYGVVQVAQVAQLALNI